MELKKYGINPEVVDPLADPGEVYNEYGISLKTLNDIKNADCIIIAVAHDIFKEIDLDDLDTMFLSGKSEQKVLINIKGIYKTKEVMKKEFTYWRL